VGADQNAVAERDVDRLVADQLLGARRGPGSLPPSASKAPICLAQSARRRTRARHPGPRSP